jgi:transcriptional regulator with XRE-family HTH domain
MSTALQVDLERKREVYGHLQKPLIAQLCFLFGLTVRDVAEIFGISKSHAAEVLNHEKFPSLDVALRMARYWEVSCEDLWGWMLDDTGERRPLVVEFEKRLIRLSSRDPHHQTMQIIEDVVADLRRQEGEKT